jgi:putative DNA primase/helicase
VKKALLKSANQAESVKGYKATMEAASTDPQIACQRSDFDRQSNLLNVANGVLNLYTGELSPHNPEYMMSKFCPTPYQPGVTHHDWDNVLTGACRNHKDLPDFLQVMAGYSAQGDKSEERIFIAYGPGGTGKGTFMDGIASTLGSEYVAAVAPETVLKQKRNSASASSDVARLDGCRIMIVSELEKGARVQESFLKSITGNDIIVARGLWKGEKEFRSQAQPWFQTNHRIVFDSTDGGNTRRYLEIPFDNILSDDTETTVDRLLKFRLRDDQNIHKAILAWIVEGCKRWQQEGFKIPALVRDATDELFETNDFLSGFFADCCEKAPENAEIISDLRSAYELWCHEQEIEPAKGKTFKDMLAERGMHQRTDSAKNNGKATTVRQWHGLSLNEDWKAKAQDWKVKVEASKRNQEEERLKNKLSLVARRNVA